MMRRRYIEQAWLYCTTAKLRAFLAILGILVGTASIVTLMSASQLATEAALSEFQDMGTDLLAIHIFQHHAADEPITHHVDHIPISTWQQLPAIIPNIKNIAPYLTLYPSMSYEGHTLSQPIIAADERLATILNIVVKQGHFVSQAESLEHHCVIGFKLAQTLQHFRAEHPLGKTIRVGDVLYTIVGIAQPWKENHFFNEDINQSLIIPIKGIALIQPNTPINTAIITFKTQRHLEALIKHLKYFIHQHIPKAGIFIRSPQQIIDHIEKQSKIFTLLLATIGGIALLVGGIGIMNMMLMSLMERHKEIGIRKALGATAQQIQGLFLTEALLFSILGGTSGVLVGIIATWIIATMNHWPFHCFLIPIIIGFIVAFMTGLFFGVYPAYRASKLDPVTSLREQ